jgi:geranylgeranyl diphosphate synthase type II
MNVSLKDALTDFSQKFDANIQSLPSYFKGQMSQAMMYPLLSGGKRIRPFLVWVIGHTYDLDPQLLLNISTSIELIHTYSLVHDDLPSMDNAAFRRGRPTAHRLYGEGQAILMGDGLLTLAFEHLSSTQGLPTDITLKLVSALAQAAGANGMVLGQWLDLLPDQESLSLDDIAMRHLLKTGALLQVSCLFAPMVARSPEGMLAIWREFGDKIGLAFQVTDDLLDIKGEPDKMGKDAYSDASKATFVSVLGASGAQKYALTLAREAHELLDCVHTPHGAALKTLHSLVDYIIERDQ